jgi:hypothetical protein
MDFKEIINMAIVSGKLSPEKRTLKMAATLGRKFYENAINHTDEYIAEKIHKSYEEGEWTNEEMIDKIIVLTQSLATACGSCALLSGYISEELPTNTEPA